MEDFKEYFQFYCYNGMKLNYSPKTIHEEMHTNHVG